MHSAPNFACFSSGLISVVQNLSQHPSPLAEQRGPPFLVLSFTSLLTSSSKKIENWQKSSAPPFLFSTFTNEDDSLNPFTMAPPQLEQAVAQVDQFMKNYPTLTQYGTSSNVMFVSCEGMVVAYGKRHLLWQE
jgi:hypothetical protein